MKKIRNIAVLGSGIMGSGIACHLANAGYRVLMLDMLPGDLSDREKSDPKARNRLASNALQQALKQSPDPLFTKKTAERISVGNFEDDLPRIAGCEWIIEVVVERLDIKQQLFERVEAHRSPGTIVTSNTSGIPIKMMAKGRSEDFRRHFCGTHFFNPPRYLRLLELIPGPDTDPAVLDYLSEFGDVHLGKETVLAKDTPAFIANRVGVFAMAKIFELAGRLGLSVQAVDKLTGPAIGRPKTGTFRLGDLVGLDTAVKVMEGVREHCPDDEQMRQFEVPTFLRSMLEKGWIGDKAGRGFYQKTDERDAQGKRVILGLNLATMAYEADPKERLDSIGLSRQIAETPQRIRALFKMDDKGGRLIRESLAALFAYAANRIPEIADELYQVDEAVKAGFAWDYGPFEYWDIVGLTEGIEAAEEFGYAMPEWVRSMAAAGRLSFYETKAATRRYFSREKSDYVPMDQADKYIVLDHYRERPAVFSNDELRVHDIGDGVLCAEFRSKSNAIGEGVLRGLEEALRIAEEEGWRGLVIGNNAPHFSVGANLLLIGSMAFQEEWEKMEMAVKLFQDVSMRCRYSAVPVVAATQGYSFGGSCEILMHCDAAVSAAESYIGLVEVGVGLIPGGGGTKEFALRASDAFFPGDVQMPTLVERFKTIATGSVSTSAAQAFELGYLDHRRDALVMNTRRNIAEAKHKVIELSRHYVPGYPREDIRVLGRQGLATLYVAANSLYRGHYASEHDIKIAKKIAWVLCGGDLTGEQRVSEQYLLDIEREAFLSLAGEPRTLERIQHMMEHNKPLRN